MHRELDTIRLPLKRVPTILAFSELGASSRTALPFYGESKQIRNLMGKTKGRPQTSACWFDSPYNTFQATIIYRLYIRARSYDNLLKYGITDEELVNVYRAYQMVVDEEQMIDFDRTFHIFTRLRDGSLLPAICKSCSNDFVGMTQHRLVDCPYCKIQKKKAKVISMNAAKT